MGPFHVSCLRCEKGAFYAPVWRPLFFRETSESEVIREAMKLQGLACGGDLGLRLLHNRLITEDSRETSRVLALEIAEDMSWCDFWLDP
jgi:hypothetical protein